MKECIASLQSILERQNHLVLELLRLGEEELEALKTDDLQALQEVIKDQQSLGESLAKLEQERLELQDYLAQKYNMPKGFTLKELAESQVPGSQEIMPLGQTLADNYSKLQELNETNNLLIRQSLSLINKMLSVFSQQSGATYGPSGQVSANSSSLKLDKSV
ncbi:MAG: flagellar protein FlgN [Zhaonellaceae bacterium]|jgi:flagellar biosynthesis/type III secretory pathway chaperone|nr:flagellar protein FlgN [Clostridia bacterium]